MNHKRKKPKNARAGCLMCKPHKMNGAKKNRGLEEINKVGFGKVRDAYHASKDLKTPE